MVEGIDPGVQCMTFCIFCEIIAGRAESARVVEDNDCIAFMDINPVNAGHVLVVPKVHADGLSDLAPEIGGRMFQAAQSIANALLKSGIKSEGLNLMLAHGKAAGQEVSHVHLHVIPRFKGDNLKIKFGLLKKKPTHSDLEQIAAQIRENL